MNGNAHVPVLMGPVLEGLGIQENGTYVDATFGRGGHSKAILDRLGRNGRLIAIDRDPEAIANAPRAITDDPRFALHRGEIAELAKIIEQAGANRVDGLLFDLGVSSPQLDQADRGFSFLRDGPLDMRMDPDTGVSAAEWLDSVEESELKRVLRKFGEESLTKATRYARAIVEARAQAPIVNTLQLADLLSEQSAERPGRRHPATKTFQAIRIVINDELGQLQRALEQCVDLLRDGGRLCVISFHSLEDRLVKRFIRDHSRVAEPYRGMPDIPAQYRAALRPVGKAIGASAAEISANPRARSARLRIAERLA